MSLVRLPQRQSRRRLGRRYHQVNCSRCNRRLEFIEVPNTETRGTCRCPDCFYATSPGMVRVLEQINLTRGPDQLCTCLCECVDPDLPEDEDFGVDDMEVDEDDLTTQLDPQTERILTARYGFFTNVVLNEDTDAERRVFVEGHGHYAAASTHDTGIPAESSLFNSENTVGRTEVNQLRQRIAPWEAEAIHLSTGRTYAELQETFPEIGRMQLPASPPAGETEPDLVCAICNRTHTPDFMHWLETSSLIMCGLCHAFRRPALPQDDPDWYEFANGSFPDMRHVLEHCRCRCNCGVGENETDIQYVRGRPVETDDTESETDYRPPRRRYSDAVPRPRMRHLHELEVPYFVEGDETSGASHGPLQARLREFFGLPEFHLSQDPERFGIATVERAFTDGRSAMALHSWDEAFRFLQGGAQFGRYYQGYEDNHYLMLQLFQNLRRVRRHLEERSNTSQDTMNTEDLEPILTANDIWDSDEEHAR